MVQIGQAINALLALTVGVLIASGELVFWHLVAAAVIQGGAMNAMMPARQAMTPDVVGMERLTNAIALNTSGMNAARLLMPGIAGFVVAALGGGDGYIAPAQWVYFANVFLYGWAMVGVGLVRVPDKPNVRPRVPGKIAFLVDETRSGWRELKLGARYVWNTPTIRLLLACNFLMVFFSMTYFMLLPGFAKDVLDTGPFRLGLLTSISGVGSLAGSLVIASLPDRRRGLILLSSSLVLGIALIAFSASTTYWLSAGLLVLVGIGQSGRMSLSNVLVQSNTADEFRGRVMSIYMMEFSLMSIGIYFVGMLANYFGPQIAVGGSAVGLVIMSLLLLIFVPTYRNLQ